MEEASPSNGSAKVSRGEALHGFDLLVELPNTSKLSSANCADEWSKAFNMLSRNPKLLNAQILHAALTRQAPPRLISFMIEINPSVASIPKHGPTPLQVALANGSPVEVIAILVQACPFALVEKDDGSDLDPLSYAKKFRSDERELIHLLSHPIKFWFQGDPEYSIDVPNKSAYSEATTALSNKSGKTIATTSTNLPYKSTETIATCGLSPIKRSSSTEKVDGRKCMSTLREPMGNWNVRVDPVDAHKVLKGGSWEDSASFLTNYACGFDSVPSVTVEPQAMRPVKNNTDDPMELKNVKLICMSVLKGHKRLTKNMAEMQKHVDELVTTSHEVSLPNIAVMLTSHGKTILKQVKDKHKKFADNQVVALKRTEHNMKEYVQQMEVRLAKSIAQRQQATHGKMEVHMDAVVKGLQFRLAKFANRIEFLEQLVFTSEMKRPSTQTHKAGRPPSVITVTVPRQGTQGNDQKDLETTNVWNTSYGTTDTYYEEAICRMANCKTSKRKGPDEKRSLLTDATSSDQSEYNLSHRSPALAPKRRWFHTLLMKSVLHRRSANA